MSESKELYLVIFDGLRDIGSYGSEIYLGGIFDSKDKADEYIRSQKELDVTNTNMIVIPINHGYETACDKYGDVTTDIYLGGYVE